MDPLNGSRNCKHGFPTDTRGLRLRGLRGLRSYSGAVSFSPFHGSIDPPSGSGGFRGQTPVPDQKRRGDRGHRRARLGVRRDRAGGHGCARPHGPAGTGAAREHGRGGPGLPQGGRGPGQQELLDAAPDQPEGNLGGSAAPGAPSSRAAAPPSTRSAPWSRRTACCTSRRRSRTCSPSTARPARSSGRRRSAARGPLPTCAASGSARAWSSPPLARTSPTR